MPRRTIAVVGALVLLRLLGTPSRVHAQGAIIDSPATFARPVSSFDSAPLANFTGVSVDPMDDHLFEMGWWYRVAGDTAEKFFPVPTTQIYVGDTANIAWSDVDGRGFNAGETDVVVSGGGGVSGQVTFALTLTNLSPDTPLSIDVFHMIDVDLSGTSGTDTATLLMANDRIGVLDGADTAEYAALGAGAFLVRPYDGTGQADVAGLLSNVVLNDFDNTGLPFAAGDFSGGFQWTTTVIPPLGAATFIAGIAVNQGLSFPAGATTTSTSTTSTTIETVSTVSTTTSTTTTVPPERCDNCADDDGDSLVDLEDNDCCAPATLILVKSSLRPRSNGVATLKLKARLADSGLVDGSVATQDVAVQIRGADELLCARIPAARLTRRPTKVRFRDAARTIESARGIDAVTLVEKRSGSAKLSVGGRQAALIVPAAGSLVVTFGLRDPATAEAANRCASSAVSFRATRKGLRYP